MHLCTLAVAVDLLYDPIMQVDISELREFEQLGTRYRKIFRQATGRYLNRLALATRNEIPRAFARLMTVRTPSFIRASLRVVRSSFYQPIDVQRSEVYSVALPGATGFAEQETGGPMMQADRTGVSRARTRIQTMAARRQKAKSKIPMGYRMSTSLVTTADIRPARGHRWTSNRQRTAALLAMMRREKLRMGAVLLHESDVEGMMKPGMYALQGRGHVTMVQATDTHAGDVRKLPWMERSVAVAASPSRIARHWDRAVQESRLWRFD